MSRSYISELLEMKPQKNKPTQKLSDTEISKNIGAMVEVFRFSGVGEGDKPPLKIVTELNVSRKLIKQCGGNPDTISQKHLDEAWQHFMSDEG